MGETAKWLDRTAVAAALLLAAVSPWPASAAIGVPGEDPVALGVYQGVREARERAGSPPLRRDRALDEAAGLRAREVAGRPEGKRFAYQKPIDDLIRAAGLRRFLRASQYVATQGGYDDDVAAVLQNWRDYDDGWRMALDRSWTAAGVATARSEDGLLVVVAVFLEDEPELADVGTLERRTLDETNAERLRRGLPALAWSQELARVARAHSVDMADRGYMGHESPEGSGPADRARVAGIGFRRLAENVARNLHMDDPVQAAVEGWMQSRSHRRNLLDERFTHTGIGVAVDDEGRVIFTQMFLLPAAP